jgi:cyclopropane fatty-acyl-phospholipid synthase-like methyltransferase
VRQRRHSDERVGIERGRDMESDRAGGGESADCTDRLAQPARRDIFQTIDVPASCMHTSETTTATFYDRLAPYYHLFCGDRERSVAKQGEALASVLQEAGVVPGYQVLDASSGIGMQTLGLLEYGYRLTASDISAGAIEPLQRELAGRALQARAHVDDLRTPNRT